MENKARYTLVGIFIIVFTLATVTFVLWLARYDPDEINSKEFRLYSTASVAGLNKKSIVEYKGLDIGFVQDIRINPNNSEEIEIILKIKKPNIIKTDSQAVIESQGVTGNKHIEIEGGSDNAAPLETKEIGYGIIPLKKSFFDTLTSQAGSITDKINMILTKVEVLLKDENIKNFDDILNNTNKSVQSFDKMVLKIENLVDKNAMTSFNNFDKTLVNIDKSLLNIDNLSNNLNEVIQKDIKETLNELKTTINSTQNIDEVILGIDETLEKIDTTLDNFNENGGDMLFKTRSVNYGPGEGEEK